MNDINEVVGSREARVAADILELIECASVTAGMTKLLGLSLEREELDQVSEYVVRVLEDISENKVVLWRHLYHDAVVSLEVNESPNN